MNAGLAQPALVRRVRLARPEAERLARVCGAALPWTLGPPRAGRDLEDAGLLVAGRPRADVLEALDVLARPAAGVRLDVVVRRDAGAAQVGSWQGWRAGRVSAVSWPVPAGDPVELGWWDDHRWGDELARAVTVRVARGPSPGAEVDLPHEVLLGAGTALREGREDLLAGLLARHPGLDPVQVRLLHTACRGRLRLVVCGPARRRTGWVSWVRFPDGWRSLTPVVVDGVATVRVRPAAPRDLVREVARLVRAVTA